MEEQRLRVQPIFAATPSANHSRHHMRRNQQQALVSPQVQTTVVQSEPSMTSLTLQTNGTGIVMVSMVEPLHRVLQRVQPIGGLLLHGNRAMRPQEHSLEISVAKILQEERLLIHCVQVYNHQPVNHVP